MVTTVVLATGAHQLHLECPALFPEVSVNTEPSLVVIKAFQGSASTCSVSRPK